MAETILVVEDEPAIRELIGFACDPPAIPYCEPEAFRKQATFFLKTAST